MNYKIQEEKIKNEFTLEFNRTIELLANSYPRCSKGKIDQSKSEECSRIALGTILINMMRQVQVDSCVLVTRDFHKKYFPNLPLLDCGDFTITERKEIIEESQLTERDKKIAFKIYAEGKTMKEAYEEMDVNEVADFKTILNNIDKISDVLKHTACIYNKSN